MEQVCGFIGAGQHVFWRRWTAFLAQVGFLGWDLRRKSWFCALCWRRSSPFFLTCAKTPIHLRQWLVQLELVPSSYQSS